MVVLDYIRRGLASDVADLIVKIAVILSVAVSSYAAWEVSENARCQARYNKADQARAEALAAPMANEQKAMATALLDPDALIPEEERTPEQQERLTQKVLAWLDAIRELEEARAANPVPPPPEELCG